MKKMKMKKMKKKMKMTNKVTLVESASVRGFLDLWAGLHQLP